MIRSDGNGEPMALHRRPFGRTGWMIGEVAFGAWQLGGQWGPIDDRASVDALLHAYERGVNLVDTAEMYGSGHSEEVVGESLRRWRGDPVRVATKVQPIRWPDPADAAPDIRAGYPADHLRAQVEASRRRLGVDCIDLLQLHCWMPSGLVDQEWRDTLLALRDAGSIDRIGVSIRDYRPEDGVALARAQLVDSIQVIYNIFEQTPAAELLPAAAASGTAIIVRVALDSGSLSGTWTPDSYASWEEGSVRKTMFRGDRFAETLERVAGVRAVTDPVYDSLDEAAVRFVLDRPEVSCVIVGMSSIEEIERDVGFGDGAGLAPELRDRLAGLGWARNFYT